MRITINRNVKTPIYLQIKNQIRDKILSKELPESFILPPERRTGLYLKNIHQPWGYGNS
ncbi:MAG: Transcriptional regulator, GntR family [Firmicutes bacterium]|nr:Transcriptional regulator, GntR family [Bacillota bacterium]